MIVSFVQIFTLSAGDKDCDKFRKSFHIQPGDWIKRMVSASLDGASVNSGHKTGLIALWKAGAPWVFME